MPDKKKILIVDDEEDFVTLLKARLEFEGFEAHQALGGATALDRMRHETFDVALLDLMMPEIDGFEVLRTIRKEGGTLVRTSIIVMTACGRDLLAAEREALGPVPFIRKPFGPDDLLEMIREAVALQRGNVHG
jgi:CheY-like chemotaxis protein